MTETDQAAEPARLRADLAQYDEVLRAGHAAALETLRALGGYPAHYRPIVYFVPDDPALYELKRKADA